MMIIDSGLLFGATCIWDYVYALV